MPAFARLRTYTAHSPWLWTKPFRTASTRCTNRVADISRTLSRSRPPPRGSTPPPIRENVRKCQESVRENVSGGERTRTADFYVANVALYQLSYTPEGSARIAPTPYRPFSPPTCAFLHRRGSTNIFAPVEKGWTREEFSLAEAADGLPADTLRIRWPLMTRGFRWAT